MLSTADVTTTSTSPRRNSLSGMAEYRKKVYGEILDTEESYVTDLNILCDRFLDPLKSIAPVAMQGELNVIGTSASMLRDFHNAFWDELSSEGVSQKILATFEDKIPYFRMYSSFCAHYASLSEAINRHQRQDEKFAKALQKLSEHPDCRNLTFLSFLIKPVQRICKYQLFFRDLLSHVSPVGPNGVGANPLHQRILHIKGAVEDISKEVNDKMFDMQRRSDAITVYKKLVPDASFNKAKFSELISKPHRILVAELELEVQVLHNGKAKRNGMFRPYVGFVFNDILALSKREKRSGLMNRKSSLEKRGEFRLKYVVEFDASVIQSDTEGLLNGAGSKSSKKRLSNSSHNSQKNESTSNATVEQNLEYEEESKESSDGKSLSHFLITREGGKGTFFAIRAKANGQKSTAQVRDLISQTLDEHIQHVEQSFMQRINVKRRGSFDAEMQSSQAVETVSVDGELIDLNDPVAMAAAAVASMELQEAGTSGTVPASQNAEDCDEEDTQDESEDDDDDVEEAVQEKNQVDSVPSNPNPASIVSEERQKVPVAPPPNPKAEPDYHTVPHLQSGQIEVGNAKHETIDGPVAVIHAAPKHADTTKASKPFRSQQQKQKEHSSFRVAYEAKMKMSRIKVRETKASKLRKTQAQELLSLSISASSGPIAATMRNVNISPNTSSNIKKAQGRVRGLGCGTDIRVSARRSTTPPPSKSRIRPAGHRPRSDNVSPRTASRIQNGEAAEVREPKVSASQPSHPMHPAKKRSPKNSKRPQNTKLDTRTSSPKGRNNQPSPNTTSPKSKGSQVRDQTAEVNSAKDAHHGKRTSSTINDSTGKQLKNLNKVEGKPKFALDVANLKIDVNPPSAPLSPTAAALKRAAALSPFKRSPLRRKSNSKCIDKTEIDLERNEDATTEVTSPGKKIHRRRPSFLERIVGTKTTDQQ